MSDRRTRAGRRVFGVMCIAAVAALVLSLWLTRERPLTETASARYAITGKRAIGWIASDQFLVSTIDRAQTLHMKAISSPAIYNTRSHGTHHAAELDDAWRAATAKASYAAPWQSALSPDERTVLISAYAIPAAGRTTGKGPAITWHHYLLDVSTLHASEVSVNGAARAAWKPNGGVRLQFPGTHAPKGGISPMSPLEFADWMTGDGRLGVRTLIPCHTPYEILLPPRSDGLVWTVSGPGAWEQRVVLGPDLFEWRGYDPAHADRPTAGYTVKYPLGRRPATGPFVSPDGRRIAWVFEPYLPDTPTWQRIIAEISSRAGRRPPRRVEEIWTSSSDGRDLRLLGHVVMINDKEFIEKLLWLPDSAHISFQRGDTLYVVRVPQ